jgi:hypothetical protein
MVIANIEKVKMECIVLDAVSIKVKVKELMYFIFC